METGGGGYMRTYSNLLATFILGGIWHGAGWTFVFWGFLHGIALVVHRIWNQLGFRLNIVIAWFVTFNFINIAWVFFRAKEWEDAIKVLKGMFGFDGIVLPNFLYGKLSFLESYGVEFGTFLQNIVLDQTHAKELIIYTIIGFVIALGFKNSSQITTKWLKIKLYVALILFIVAIVNFDKQSEFLYFNF